METIVKEIRDCAASLSRIADMLADAHGCPSAVAPAKQEQQPKAATPTLEEVRTVLVRLSQSGLTAEVRELLKKHGADRLSALDPARYDDVLKEAESLGT